MQLSNKRPEKRLTLLLPKKSGRDAAGHITVRHQGGRHKRLYRTIDWKRDKYGVVGTVVALEYDPNRTTHLALVQYTDGECRYITAPEGISVNDSIVSGERVPIKLGNALKIANIPVGTQIHNIELTPQKGAQIVRSAGSFATILSKEGTHAQIKLPSGEIRLVRIDGLATIGQAGNAVQRTIPIGTAGRARRMGRRPTVRGVAQHPGSHPHGGGEGKSGIGMKSPKSPWGKRTLGKITRKPKKYSDNYIVKNRRRK